MGYYLFMPHSRSRIATRWIQKLEGFWPSVGVTGLRQVGKTTLLREQMGISNFVSFDDEDTRETAENSAKVFLAQLTPPVIIDEVQKVPKLFDAIKSKVDRGKRPGLYYLTGSSQFSAKLGIRESLTGRIGLIQLFPMILRELNQVPDGKSCRDPLHQNPIPFKVEDVASAMNQGGMPVPAFLRDSSMLEMYWKSWLETIVYRDLTRVYGKGYDPEIAMDLLRQMGKLFAEGELPTSGHFRLHSRKLKLYFQAMETVFLIRRFRCHETGTGKDYWLLGDSGLVRHLMNSQLNPGGTLSLVRHFVLNEMIARNEYAGVSLPQSYFKSAKGKPVDFIWNNVPIKFVERIQSLGWEERALEGAMKKLGAPLGILACPSDSVNIPKKGIATVPWSYWS